MEDIETECLTSSEVKLDIFLNTVEEMMKNITMRDEIIVQDDHVSMIEGKKVVDLKHFPSYLSFHRSDND